jgi:mycothiol conjugate amidase Mca
MSEALTLMTVHAHPDDEAIGTGGVLARYADEGVRTVLVTCTGGEVGEIADRALAIPETLAEVRRRELERACEILRVASLHLLGYRDSGMMGTPDNEHPSSFYRAPLEEATARLVALVRRHRPQVLVTYDERGFYGHPDHIKAHQITVAAFDAAGDPARWPETGAPWQPVKLYYTAVARSAIRDLGRLLRGAGIDPPFEDDGEKDDPEIGIADELVTTQIDVSAHVERKRQALLAHATQMGPEVFFTRMPPPLFHQVFGRESFRLVRGNPGASGLEGDLFAGLRG